MSTEAKVAKRPDCDVCKLMGVSEPALYDVATKYGPWAYVCLAHFTDPGIGELGTGRGQWLVVDDDVRS